MSWKDSKVLTWFLSVVCTFVKLDINVIFQTATRGFWVKSCCSKQVGSCKGLVSERLAESRQYM